jgi:hypothetical protein
VTGYTRCVAGHVRARAYAGAWAQEKHMTSLSPEG